MGLKCVKMRDGSSNFAKCSNKRCTTFRREPMMTENFSLTDISQLCMTKNAKKNSYLCQEEFLFILIIFNTDVEICSRFIGIFSGIFTLRHNKQVIC